MYCGADCLVYAEKESGRVLTRERAMRLAGTRSTGTRAKGMLAALDALDYRARLVEDCTWGKLRGYVKGGYTVFVPWWSDIDDGKGHPMVADGHWSVVRGMTARAIRIYDPDADKVIRLGRAFWMARWWDWERDERGQRHDLVQAAVVAKRRRARRKV